jgi:two-component system, LytTR family, response regulator
MQPIRTLIIAGDAGGLNQLQNCAEKEPGLNVVGTVVDASPATAAVAVRAMNPELVFLDLGQYGNAAPALVRQWEADHGPTVVIVTTEDEMRRIDLSVFDSMNADVLVKPVDQKRFRHAVRQAGDRMDRAVPLRVTGNQAQDTRQRLYPQRMIARQGRRMIVVDLDRVRYIQGAGNYLSLHSDNQTYSVRMKLSDLAEQLDPKKFARVHRSTIINMRHVRAFRPIGSRTYMVTLESGEEIRMSSSYSRRILSSYYIAPDRYLDEGTSLFGT